MSPVSILVLMEVTLKDPQHSALLLLLLVSILVLMEVTLKETITGDTVITMGFQSLF